MPEPFRPRSGPTRSASAAGNCARRSGVKDPRLFALLRFNAFVDAAFRREGADYDFPLNPKHAAAALRLSQNRPRPAPISILSALP